LWRLGGYAVILAAWQLLTPLCARADSFSFPTSGNVTGSYNGTPSTQNLGTVGYGVFDSFSADGFTFTGLFGDPYGKSNPGGACFTGSSGSNCVPAQLYLVGNSALAAFYGFGFPSVVSGSYLSIPVMNDKSAQFGYSQVVVITNDTNTAFSLQDFNASQTLPPNFTGGFHANAASVFWQAALAGGGSATGNCLFPAGNGPMLCNVGENDIISLTVIGVNAAGQYAADWGITNWDGSTSPATSNTPEPGTLVLLGSGLIAAAARLRKHAIKN
jgi:hypothetical protein